MSEFITVGTVLAGIVFFAASTLAGIVSRIIAEKLSAGEPIPGALIAVLFETVLLAVVAILGVFKHLNRRIHLLKQLGKEIGLVKEEAQQWALSFVMSVYRATQLRQKLDTIRVFLARTYDSERSGPSVDLFCEGLELWSLVRLNLDASAQSYLNVANLLSSALPSYELEVVVKYRTEIAARRMELETAVANVGRSIVQLETALPRLKRSIELELGMHEDVDEEVRGL